MVKLTHVVAVAIIYPYGLEQPCLFWQTFLVRLPVLPAAPSLQEPKKHPS